MMAAIMSVLMIMVTESMTTLSSVRSEQRTGFRVSAIADKMARRIEEDIEFASRIFVDTVDDAAHLQAMQLGVSLDAPSYRLPALTEHGYFAPDRAVPETGNVLMLAKRGPKVSATYLAADYHIDSLVFVVYAPVADGSGLELIRWTSEIMVNYWDIMEISDVLARQDILQQLYDNEVFYCWDMMAEQSSAFWEIGSDGTLTPRSVSNPVTGREDPDYSRMLRARRIQIAENGAEIPHDVPAFAVAETNFPHGFEVKVDGSSAGKLVLVRMVMRSRDGRVRTASHEIHRLYTTNG